MILVFFSNASFWIAFLFLHITFSISATVNYSQYLITSEIKCFIYLISLYYSIWFNSSHWSTLRFPFKSHQIFILQKTALWSIINHKQFLCQLFLLVNFFTIVSVSVFFLLVCLFVYHIGFNQFDRKIWTEFDSSVTDWFLFLHFRFLYLKPPIELYLQD